MKLHGSLCATLLLLVPAVSITPVHRGIWAYFCYEDSASMDGSSSPGHYSAECWKQQSVAKSPFAKGTLLMVKWSHVEPRDGVFTWDVLEKNITAASNLGLQLLLAVEICKADVKDPATPPWLYDDVVGVNFSKSGTQKSSAKRCPYYLDAAFQSKFTRLMNSFARFIATLPASSKAAVVGVQAMLGITGDDRPWNGIPMNKSLSINNLEWKAYTRTMAQKYCSTFMEVGIPVLFNLNNPGYNHSDDQWILSKCHGSMVKQGIVSHGYQLNTELDLYKSWHAQGLTRVVSRGELAVEPNPKNGTYGNWAVSPQWSLQANAEWGLTFGLGIWNLYSGFLGNNSFDSTLDFFNRHAPQIETEKATAAFISFRDSLDTEDVERFPESYFGPLFSGQHQKLNGQRITKIAESMAKYGARVDDVKEASSKKSVVQKKGMFLNDVCYRCWPGNYFRYLHQVNASTSSVGRWRVGDVSEPYGRFARALEHSSGRTAIRLALDKSFAAFYRMPDTGSLNLTLRVVYLDFGEGSWQLAYRSQAGMPRLIALTVQKSNSGHWKMAEANVEIVLTTASDYDFALSSLTKEDDVFSLMEVLVTPPPVASVVI